jgi:filamentous hemagglutinin
LDSEQRTNLNQTGTSVGSKVSTGGNVTLNAGRTATVQGSDVVAGGNLDLSGKDVNVVAGENTTRDATHTEKTSYGLSGHADANSTGWDLSRETTTTDTLETTSTARTSTLKAGGDVNRSALGTIKDVGTQIEAGGNVSQSATTIDSRAAANTATSTSSSVTEKVSIGPSIDYNIGAAIDDANNGSTSGAAQASGGPTVGNTAKYTNDSSNSSSSSSQAVTSSIKAGGSVSSTSQRDTTLEGTQIESGGNTDIAARNLSIKAAQDTNSSSSDSTHIGASVRGEIDAAGKPGGSISGEYSTSESQSAGSNAVVGTIKSGGDVNVTTTGDTRLEGTKIESAGDTTIDADGSVKMDAARNTESSSGSSMGAAGSVSASKGSGGVSGSYESSSNSASSSEAVTGSVDAGGDLTIRSGKDIVLEGADLSAGKDASISAGGKVEAADAVSTSQSESESLSVSGSISASKGSKGQRSAPEKNGMSGAVGGGGSYSSESSSTTTKKESTIEAGGDVKVEENATRPQ